MHKRADGGKQKKGFDHIIGSKWFIPAIIISAMLLLFRINGVSLAGCYFDAYILFIFRTLCNTLVGQLFIGALASIGVFAVLYYMSKHCVSVKFCKTATIIFAAVLTFESIIAFAETKKNLGYMEKDAIELCGYTDGSDSLFLDDGFKRFMVDHYAYDVQSRDTVYYTTFNELINNCEKTGGEYEPFYITTIGEHVNYDTILPDELYFVFSGVEADLCDFSDDADVYKTQNGAYTAVKPLADGRIFDSVFTSNQTGIIAKSGNNFISLYSPELLGGKELKLRMKVSSESGAATLTISAEAGAQNLSVTSSSSQWVECSVYVPHGYSWIDITASSDVGISAYELTAAE